LLKTRAPVHQGVGTEHRFLAIVWLEAVQDARGFFSQVSDSKRDIDFAKTVTENARQKSRNLGGMDGASIREFGALQKLTYEPENADRNVRGVVK
jgi:hypothetical protein